MATRRWMTSQARGRLLGLAVASAVALALGGTQGAGGALDVTSFDRDVGTCGVAPGKVALVGGVSLSFVRTDRQGDLASIFLVSRDGRHVTRLLPGKGSVGRFAESALHDPVWSRDGRCLAFAAEEVPVEGMGSEDVYVLTPEKKQIAIPGGMSGFSGAPSWAPGGRRLVLVGYQSQAGGGLYIRPVGTGSSKTLTFESMNPDDPVDDTPAWSPDGKTIAFARTGGSRTGLYLIRADGTDLERVREGKARNPSWSPDGKRLVFDTGSRIALIDADGRHFKYITSPGRGDSDPAWSPDGRAIAFVRGENIWVMGPAGRDQRLLVRDAEQPAWKRR